MKKCPYCNVELEKFPQLKKKCPNCGNIVFVRTKSNKRLFFTEKGDKEYEERKNSLSDGKSIGVTEEQFIQEKDKLNQKLGLDPWYPDTVWKKYHKAIHHYIKENNYLALKSLYYIMFDSRLSEGTLDNRTLEMSHRFQLLDFKYDSWRHGGGGYQLR